MFKGLNFFFNKEHLNVCIIWFRSSDLISKVYIKSLIFFPPPRGGGEYVVGRIIMAAITQGLTSEYWPFSKYTPRQWVTVAKLSIKDPLWSSLLKAMPSQKTDIWNYYSQYPYPLAPLSLHQYHVHTHTWASHLHQWINLSKWHQGLGLSLREVWLGEDNQDFNTK